MPKENQIIEKINANGTEITVLTNIKTDDFISLTDIAKYRDAENPRFIIQNWMRNRNTVFYLGLWETINNPDFNRVEFEAVKSEAGLNSFVLTPQKWIKSTQAIGITSKAGRYDGGTFAHKDIAFEFASWISPEFKLYIIKDYQRLKESENHQLKIDWNIKRLISKTNYKIHTDAIKENLIPSELSAKQIGIVYASEADVLNVALFGQTASDWRKSNPESKGNMRDEASIEQLLVLTNLENLNAFLIQKEVPQSERLTTLRNEAVSQLSRIIGSKSVKTLNELHNKKEISTKDNNLLSE